MFKVPKPMLKQREPVNEELKAEVTKSEKEFVQFYMEEKKHSNLREMIFSLMETVEKETPTADRRTREKIQDALKTHKEQEKEEKEMGIMFSKNAEPINGNLDDDDGDHGSTKSKPKRGLLKKPIDDYELPIVNDGSNAMNQTFEVDAKEQPDLEKQKKGRKGRGKKTAENDDGEGEEEEPVDEAVKKRRGRQPASKGKLDNGEGDHMQPKEPLEADEPIEDGPKKRHGRKGKAENVEVEKTPEPEEPVQEVAKKRAGRKAGAKGKNDDGQGDKIQIDEPQDANEPDEEQGAKSRRGRPAAGKTKTQNGQGASVAGRMKKMTSASSIPEPAGGESDDDKPLAVLKPRSGGRGLKKTASASSVVEAIQQDQDEDEEEMQAIEKKGRGKRKDATNTAQPGPSGVAAEPVVPAATKPKRGRQAKGKAQKVDEDESEAY